MPHRESRTPNSTRETWTMRHLAQEPYLYQELLQDKKLTSCFKLR